MTGLTLFLPGAGAKIEHLKRFRAADGVDAVIVSDISADAAGAVVADACYVCSPFASPDFASQMASLLEGGAFDCCLPIHDASLKLLSTFARQEPFRPFFLVNGEEVIDIARDKLASIQLLDRLGLRTPRTETLAGWPAWSDFPAFVKPRYIEFRGTPRGVFERVDDRPSLAAFAESMGDDLSSFVIQPYIDAPEYNCDYFCDDDGAIAARAVVSREAMGPSRGISAGQVYAPEDFAPAMQGLERLCDHLRFVGPNQLQFYWIGGEPVFTEFNARMGGSAALVSAAGLDLHQATVDLILGKSLSFGRLRVGMRMTVLPQEFYYTHDVQVLKAAQRT